MQKHGHADLDSSLEGKYSDSKEEMLFEMPASQMVKWQSREDVVLLCQQEAEMPCEQMNRRGVTSASAGNCHKIVRRSSARGQAGRLLVEQAE